MSDDLDDLSRALAQSKSRPAASPMPSRPRQSATVHLPDYFGIRLGAAVLRIMAGLYVLCSFFVFLSVLGTLVSRPRHLDGPWDVPQESVGIKVLFGLSLFGIAALLFLAASVASAIRDMARNSFYWRNR